MPTFLSNAVIPAWGHVCFSVDFIISCASRVTGRSRPVSGGPPVPAPTAPWAATDVTPRPVPPRITADQVSASYMYDTHSPLSIYCYLIQVCICKHITNDLPPHIMQNQKLNDMLLFCLIKFNNIIHDLVQDWSGNCHCPKYSQCLPVYLYPWQLWFSVIGYLYVQTLLKLEMIPCSGPNKEVHWSRSTVRCHSLYRSFKHWFFRKEGPLGKSKTIT